MTDSYPTIDHRINCFYNSTAYCLDICNDNRFVEVILHRDWTSLETLKLKNCDVDDNGLKTILSLDWPQLQHLTIDNTDQIRIGNVLAVMDYHSIFCLFDTARCIHISGGPEQLTIFRKMKIMSEITILKSSFSSKGLTNLPACNFSRLIQLNLDHSNLMKNGVQMLIKTSLPLLTQVSLQSCNLNNEGFWYLSKSDWPNISKVYLSHNKISIDGSIALSKANWPKLEILLKSFSSYSELMWYCCNNWQYAVTYDLHEPTLLVNPAIRQAITTSFKRKTKQTS